MIEARWTWHRFAELGVDNLYDALQLRCRVFVLEQGPYLDPDGLDRQSWHLLGRDAAGTLLSYLRVVDPGVPQDLIERRLGEPPRHLVEDRRAVVPEGASAEL